MIMQSAAFVLAEYDESFCFAVSVTLQRMITRIELTQEPTPIHLKKMKKYFEMKLPNKLDVSVDSITPIPKPTSKKDYFKMELF